MTAHRVHNGETLLVGDLVVDDDALGHGEERGEQRGRNRTDGAYGIWGYDLQDLVLTAVRWTRRPDGKVTIDLHVESWGLRLTP